MSTSPNRASNPSNPSNKSKAKDVTLDLPTARKMLPLVRSIVTDIVTTHQKLDALGPEQERLDRNRRALDWSSRERRYSIQDEINSAEQTLTGMVGELSALGVRLTDVQAGSVDFPTRINGRQAAFSWQLGEDGLGFWRYAGEDLRRPIPSDWQSTSSASARYRSEP
jgi:hypothetical protein